MVGKVWLVGAGPGDPGLITVKGSRVLAAADAVIYDRLANPALLHGLPASCELIDAGKRPRRAMLSQVEINRLLVRLAGEGKRVVRLKGGDPFVFGRGGEEAEACLNAGVPVEVIPGVSSAIAVPAYAGIPVTHRGVAASFAVLTGHEDPGRADSQVNWVSIAHGVDTLICLMGVESLDEIASRLIEAGRSPSTPAAVIAWGTLPRQRTVVGVLGDIAERVGDAGLGPPAVAVFGDVVRLRGNLKWFEGRPLFGMRVLVTRTREQASALRLGLEEEGAEVMELATLEIVDGASALLLGRMIDGLDRGEYSWVIFTSANAVRRFFRAVHESGRDARVFHDSKVAVVGPGTRESLREVGIHADAMPDEYEGESLAGLLAGHDLARRRVLVPRAEAARPELVRSLRSQGAEVEEIPLYSTEVPRNPDATILSRIHAGEIDVVTFASSSAVRNLATMLGDDLTSLQGASIACIGPVTAETAKRRGLRVDVVAADHTVPGLIEALREHFRGTVGELGRGLTDQ